MKNIFLMDMDDTLLDFGKAERANLTQTLSQFGIEADDRIYDLFHEINERLWKALERGETDRERLKEERFERLFSQLGLKGDVPAVARAYYQNFPRICFPFEGAIALLKELQNRGRVCICTNGGAEIQRAHIQLAGFAPYLEEVFISEEIGADKPSAAFADYVESHIAHYSRKHAVWIGDSLTSDGACAKGRGIDFILFAPHGVPAGYPDRAATTYEALLRLI